MPKIQLTKDGGSVIYDKDDWLAGIDTTSAAPNNGRGNGNPLMSQVDPLRLYGYISPGFNPVAVTNNSTLTAVVRNGVVRNSKAYLIAGDDPSSGSDGRIHELTLSSDTITASGGVFPYNINHGHTGERGNDVVAYHTGATTSLVAKMFYSFNDDTDWDVGTFNYTSTFDDDFMSTVPTGTLGLVVGYSNGKVYPHPLEVGEDDVLYIGDRNYLHAYDGATNIFSAAVLTLPEGWIITCMRKMENDKMAVGAYYETGTTVGDPFYRGEARMWIYNYVDLDIEDSFDLRDNYVSELINWAGTIAAFTSGPVSVSGRTTNIAKLKIFTGSKFETFKTWGTGGLPIRGGVDNIDDDLYWNSGGAIYALTKRPDNGVYILNHIIGPGSGVSGILKFFTQAIKFHASIADSSSLNYYNTDYNDAGQINCEVVSPEFPVLKKGDLTQITIKFANTFSGGRTIRLNGVLDGSEVTLINDLQSNTLNRTVQVTNRSDGTPLGTFSTLQPELIFADNGTGSNRQDSAPIIDWIRFDFKFVNYSP